MKTVITPTTQNWYVLYTRPKFEKSIYEHLTEEGIEVFLPLQKVLRQWSDRKKYINVPFFPGYVFVHIRQNQMQLPLRVNGVIRYVRNEDKRPSIIREEEIDLLNRILINRKAETVKNLEFVDGDEARIIGGPFKGLTGHLMKSNKADSFVIHVSNVDYYLSIELFDSDIVSFNKLSTMNIDR